MKIELTIDQRRAIDDLWFVYGNSGPKSSFSQHKFIQALLERGEYEPEVWRGKRAAKVGKAIAPKNNFNNYLLSEECVEAVSKIISPQPA